MEVESSNDAGNFQIREILLIWIIPGQVPTVLTIRAGVGYLDFSLASGIQEYIDRNSASKKHPDNQPKSQKLQSV